MKFIPIHYQNNVIGIELFQKKSNDEWDLDLTHIKWDAETAARELIQSFEEEVCIAFLEALIVQTKKSINRHAKWCMDSFIGEDREDDPPEWWSKYQDAGL